LVGRKKEMIVTAGGTKIHPEIPEAEIDACPEVARSVVFADQDSTGLVAVIVPKNLQDHSARMRIQQFIDTRNGRRPALTIRRVLFSDEAFSRENGLLRPNLKLDRNKIGERFLRTDQEMVRLEVARSA
jgi:long-subunit acyl-CoA synthetase (AMP-forming)